MIIKNYSRIQELRERELSKLYFIHIPKTGGSFVRDVLGRSNSGENESLYVDGVYIDGNHASFHSLEKDQGYRYLKNYNKYKDHLVFAVVRNPFDMLVSMSRAKVHGFSGMPTRDIKKYCNEKIGWAGIRHMLFHQIFDDKGVCRVDAIIRNEFLEEGLVEVGKLVTPHIVPNIPIRHLKNPGQHRINASSRVRDYKDYYCPQLQRKVEEKCKIELDLFGYTFDGPVDNDPIIFLDESVRFKTYSNKSCDNVLPRNRPASRRERIITENNEQVFSKMLDTKKDIMKRAEDDIMELTKKMTEITIENISHEISKLYRKSAEKIAREALKDIQNEYDNILKDIIKKIENDNNLT